MNNQTNDNTEHNQYRIQIDVLALDGELSRMAYHSILREIEEVMERRLKGVMGSFAVKDQTKW